MLYKDYEINNETLVIIPSDKKVCKSYETTQEVNIQKNPIDIINESCKSFGSSYIGRFEGSKSLLNINYKVPIIIEEVSEMIFFPTTSPRNPRCCWVSLNHIKRYERQAENTKVFFDNNTSIVLEISYQSFANQFYRATRLLLILKTKKNLLK